MPVEKLSRKFHHQFRRRLSCCLLYYLPFYAPIMWQKKSTVTHQLTHTKKTQTPSPESIDVCGGQRLLTWPNTASRVSPVTTAAHDDGVTAHLPRHDGHTEGVRRLEYTVWSAPFGVHRLEYTVWSTPIGVHRLEYTDWSTPFGVH